MKKFILILCCVALFLPACKKDEKSKSKTELISNGSWHVTAYTVDPAVDYDGDGTDENNIFAVMEECVIDDHTTFLANGNCELDEGATKCDPGDPQTFQLAWSFDDNESHIEVDGINYEIETLTENQMLLKEIETIQAVTYTHRVTFVH